MEYKDTVLEKGRGSWKEVVMGGCQRTLLPFPFLPYYMDVLEERVLSSFHFLGSFVKYTLPPPILTHTSPLCEQPILKFCGNKSQGHTIFIGCTGGEKS